MSRSLRRSPFLAPKSPCRLISNGRNSFPNRPAAEKNVVPCCDVIHSAAASSDTPAASDAQHETSQFHSFSAREIPSHSTIPSRSEDYNFSKARLHSSLWREEVQRHFGMASHEAGGSESLSVGDGIQEPDANFSEDWESFVRPGERLDEETVSKEENMLLEEIERRKEYNRVQVAKFVKQHLYARRRPGDGWKYIVNSFGVTKGAKLSAFQLDEHRTSELEKLALKRELKSHRRT